MSQHTPGLIASDLLDHIDRLRTINAALLAALEMCNGFKRACAAMPVEMRCCYCTDEEMA